MIAPARLAWILQPCKAPCQALDHAARPRLHRTGNGQHGPQSASRPKLMREPWVPKAISALCMAPVPPGCPSLGLHVLCVNHRDCVKTRALQRQEEELSKES